MSEKKLVEIVDQQTVMLEGAEIIGAIADDQTVYVPLRQFCDFLGVDWQGQRQRTIRHHFYSEYLATVAVTATDGRLRQQLALPVDLAHGWLLGINPDRIRAEETAEKIRKFQRDAHRLLFELFSSNMRPSPAANIITTLNLTPMMMEDITENRGLINLTQLDVNSLRRELMELRDELRKLKGDGDE